MESKFIQIKNNNDIDTQILALFEQSDYCLNRTTIAIILGISRNRVGKRLQTLAGHGFVVRKQKKETVFWGLKK